MVGVGVVKPHGSVVLVGGQSMVGARPRPHVRTTTTPLPSGHGLGFTGDSGSVVVLLADTLGLVTVPVGGPHDA